MRDTQLRNLLNSKIFIDGSQASFEEKRRGHLCLWISLLTGVAFLFYQVTGIRMGFESYLLVLPILLNLTAITLLKVSKSVKLACRICVSSILIGLCLLIAKFGGYQALTLYALPIVPLAASFLLTKREAYLWTFLISVCSVGICQLQLDKQWDYFVYPEQKKILLTNIMLFVLPFLSCAITVGYEHERILNQNALQEKNKQLSDALRSKGNLVSILIHDVNNHLSIVDFSSVLLERTSDPEKIKSCSNRIRRATNNMIDIVSMVKDMEAVERGKKNISTTSVDLRKIAGEVQFTFEKKAKDKKLNISIRIDEAARWVEAEPRSLLNQVVNNIVSNAIKFSFEGGTISIISKVHKDMVLLSIEDKGIGIPDKLLKSMFEHNVETSRLGTDGEKGTGFGLPITKTYMDSFGGRIEVSSKTKDEFPNSHGSKFFLYFAPASPLTSERTARSLSPSTQTA